MNNSIIQLIQADFELQDKYIAEYYDKIRITCKYCSNDFLNNLKNDYYVNRDIDNYNKKQHKEYNFTTYIIQFPYVLYNWARICDCDNTWKEYKTSEEYEFEFTVKKNDDVPTLDEYRKMQYKHIHIKDNEVEPKNVIKKSPEQKLTVEQFLANVKKSIEIEKKKNMSKRRSIGKKIEKYDLNGNLLETYDNRKECIEKNNLTNAGLSQHLNGKRKSLNGYIYKEI